MSRHLIIFLLFLVSCQPEQKWNATSVCEKIFKPDDGQFKNFEIGMSRHDFDNHYTGDAIYSNPNELIDSLTIDEFVYCETAFSFYKDHLSEIVVRIEVIGEDKKDALLMSIFEKLEGDYGKYIQEGDYYFWRIEGTILTTDLYLSEQPRKGGDEDKKFVISLYYTVGTDVS